MTGTPASNRRTPWRTVASTFGRCRPTSAVRHWLLEPGSLTRALGRHLGHAPGLELIGQIWQRPALDEARLLDIGPERRCLERRVSLGDGELPLILARTLVPVSSLSGGNRRLGRLGTRPLGDALFADPGLHRRTLEWARLNPGSPLFPGLDEWVWARRSVYVLGGRPLLVYEAFLPALTGIGPLAPAAPLAA